MLKQVNFSRWVIISISLIGLLAVYLLQKNITSLLQYYDLGKFGQFAATKSIRFLLNDLLMILLIYGLFNNKKYTLFAFYVQVFGVICLLMPYLGIKYFYVDYNGPLISYLHRLIVNPLLMLMLIPAFIYKEKMEH